MPTNVDDDGTDPDAGPQRAEVAVDRDATGPAIDRRQTRSPFYQRREAGILVCLLIMIGLVSMVNPRFLGADNIRDKLVAVAPLAIVACGMTLVILTGEIDIAVGSLMGFCAAVLGSLSSLDRYAWPAWLCVLITLGLGTGIGLLNGMLVALTRVPSIIVTLGMLTILRGLSQWIVGPTWIQRMPDELRFIGNGELGGIRISILVAVVTVIIFHWTATQTPLGLRIYAVGSNRRAARLAGVSERMVKVIVFGLMGMLAAIATIISAPQLSIINSDFGKWTELFIITCVVVGGTSVSGGRGTLWGSILAVLLLSLIGTVLIFLQLGLRATYWERTIMGILILVAVLLDRMVVIRAKPVSQTSS